MQANWWNETKWHLSSASGEGFRVNCDRSRFDEYFAVDRLDLDASAARSRAFSLAGGRGANLVARLQEGLFVRRSR